MLHYGYTPGDIRRLTLSQFITVCLGQLSKVSPDILRAKAAKKAAAEREKNAPAKPSMGPRKLGAPISIAEANRQIAAIYEKKKREGVIK